MDILVPILFDREGSNLESVEISTKDDLVNGILYLAALRVEFTGKLVQAIGVPSDQSDTISRLRKHTARATSAVYLEKLWLEMNKHTRKQPLSLQS